MKEDQKRAFLTVALCGVILFGWQYFFAPEVDYSATMKDGNKKVAQTVENNSGSSEIKASEQNTDIQTEKISELTLKNEIASYTLNSNLEVINANSFENNSIYSDYFKSNSFLLLFNFNESFQKLSFSLVSQDDTSAKLFNEKYNLNLDIKLDEKGFLNYSFQSTNEFTYKVVYGNVKKGEEGSSFMAFSQPKSSFGYYASDYNTIPMSTEDSGDKKIKWASVDNEYHMLATIFDKEVPYLFKTTESGEFNFFTNEKVKNLDFKQVFTRKEYDYLKSLGHKLDLSIDFGIWGIIAIPILRGLQFFYTVIPNYGIAIIFLTILIRLLTFPLQYKSFKSMKKMQEIQPELNKVRERFKDNPQKMQQETMALFKKSGANPLGGCLPLVLQMPIFFAFYRVLYSSVELVGAPFMLWISDLSVKDPFYILPVLMAFAMVLNQKLMPTTTTDPVQKKVMMFVPLIFAIFMKDFPAGLTLYIFVSTLVGMLQQLYVYKRA